MKKILFVTIFSLLLFGCNKGFKPEEIQSIENEIKQSYIKKGWHEVEVTLVKNSDYQLTGFVKGISGQLSYYFQVIPLSASCNVTKDMDSNKYFWTCK
jgi:hypothetical protein